MDYQYVYINGKQRQAIKIRGRLYLRKGYNVPIETGGSFESKCDILGEDEGKIVEKLIQAFIEVSGWGENTQRPATPETRAGYHVKDAVSKVKRGLFPWRISEN